MNAMRAALLGLACVLGALSIWLLTTEILRSEYFVFAINADANLGADKRREAALAAARVGLLRGDLWTDATAGYGAILQDKNVSGAPLDEMRAVTETAVAYAPHDSRLWLLLAAIYSRSDQLKAKTLAALKMSYYTGPNSITILPQRLLLAVISRALDGDDEIREFVRYDIRTVDAHKTDLMPALMTAYNHASPSARAFIEKSLAEIDPGALPLTGNSTQHR